MYSGYTDDLNLAPLTPLGDFIISSDQVGGRLSRRR
jgi:hypothetical protein